MKHLPTRLSSAGSSTPDRFWHFLVLVGISMLLASCSEDSMPSEPPTVLLTGMEPLAAGIKTLGYALIGGCVIVVLGKLIR